MVKVQGVCDKPFWINKRLNNCAAPAPDSDDVLVVASLACPTHKNASSSRSTTKTSSLSGTGRRNYSIASISKTAYRMHLGPSPFDSAPRTLPDMKLGIASTLTTTALPIMLVDIPGWQSVERRPQTFPQWRTQPQSYW